MNFEPGDVVEVVKTGSGAGGTKMPCGSLWTVEASGLWPTGQTWLKCIGSQPPVGFPGFDAAAFRLLKRRDPEIMYRLMNQPAPELETV